MSAQLILKRKMCNCAKIHFYEVEFKLAGMRVIPTHKNCGDPMTDEQSTKFQKELVQYWRIDKGT